MKLSIHASGFAQFSSVGPEPIRSGKGPFHVPKGLGMQVADILHPIDTGPTWLATFYNASECQELQGRERVPVMLFGPRDFFERDDHDFEGRHVFLVEGFTFPSTRRQEAYPGAHGWTMTTGYGIHRPEWEVDFRVFDLPSSLAFLGILVSVRHDKPELQGGYSLSGPKDIVTGVTLQAMFPLPSNWDDAANIESLEYIPDVDTLGAS